MKNTTCTPSVIRRKIGIFALFCVVFSGCVRENDVPAYLSIPSFSLITTSAQGSASHKITDVWVFVDGIALGAFQLPALLPVVGVGSRNIQLFAGIRNNGIKANPIIYTPYKLYETTLILKSGETETLRPTTTYTSNTRVWLNDEFEIDNSFRIDKDNNTNLKFTSTPNGFEGKGAVLTLTQANPLMEKASSIKAQLPDNAQDTYIELNYKTEAPLAVGIWGTSSNNPLGEITYKIVLTPNTTWNKTYINITNECKDLKKTDFQVIFRSIKPDTLSQAAIYIDNVKLIQR